MTAYVDDLLLFLRDTESSLQAALSILDSFSVVSALKVNWTKSKSLPLRSHPMPGHADPTIYLQWITQTRYLGMIIMNSVAVYITLNISPLLSLLKQIKCLEKSSTLTYQ